MVKANRVRFYLVIKILRANKEGIIFYFFQPLRTKRMTDTHYTGEETKLEITVCLGFQG